MDNPKEYCYASYGMTNEANPDPEKSDVLQGTLDLMVLQSLDALGPLHGYGIARRIEQISEKVLQLNVGTVYTALLRLQQRKWISPPKAANNWHVKPKTGPASPASSDACWIFLQGANSVCPRTTISTKRFRPTSTC
jgi:hypothetical protein